MIVATLTSALAGSHCIMRSIAVSYEARYIFVSGSVWPEGITSISITTVWRRRLSDNSRIRLVAATRSIKRPAILQRLQHRRSRCPPRSLQADTLLVAGVHLHGCVRATVLDAYQRGFVIWVAADAVASDDPLHAAITRSYLARRCARFVPVTALLEWLSPASVNGAGPPASPK
jgi:isochorismate hydrolase